MKTVSEWIIGIDLGDRSSVGSMLNRETGERKDLEFAMTGEDVRKVFGSMERCQVMIEVGAQSRWVNSELLGLGYDVTVMNARQNALIAKSMSKSDRLDAAMLADIGASSPRLVRKVHHRSEEEQSDLIVIRSRDVLVRARTEVVNVVRGIAKTKGHRFTESSPAALSKAEVPESLRPALEGLMRMIATLSEEIAAYDKAIEAIASARYPQVDRMTEIFGVGVLTALLFVLVVADPKRFKKSRDVGPYLGLKPGLHESGRIRKQLGITKAGDRLLRRNLVQCAALIMRQQAPDTDLKRFGEAIAKRGGKGAKQRARVAVARKLAVLLHRLLVDPQPYEALRSITVATQKNAKSA